MKPAQRVIECISYRDFKKLVVRNLQLHQRGGCGDRGGGPPSLTLMFSPPRMMMS